MKKKYKTIKKLNLEKKPKITVLAYDDLYEYIPSEKSILIRLHIEENEDLSFEKKYINILKINIIDEWDINNPKFKNKLFTNEHSLEIYNFVTNYLSNIHEIVIHCKAGLSRSPSVAICLLNFLGEKEQGLNYIHKYRAMPNRLIIETMSKTIEDTDFFYSFIKEIEKRGLYRGYEDLIHRKKRM